MFHRLFAFFRRHKISTVGAVIVAVVVYFTFGTGASNLGPTLYTTATAEMGVLNVSVSGSGQVAAITQVDIKPKVSGNVLSISIEEGQEVKAGTILVQLDTKDLQTQVTQASLSLEMAKANLNTKLAPITKEDLAIAKNAVASAQNAYDNSQLSLESAKEDTIQSLHDAQVALEKSRASKENAQKQYDSTLATISTSDQTTSQNVINIYNDAKTSLSSTILTLRNALPKADAILAIDQTQLNSAFKINLGALNAQSKVDADNAYPVAKLALIDLEQKYASISSNWNQKEVDNLLVQSVAATQKMQDLIHKTYLLLTYSMTGGSFTQATLDSFKNGMSSEESGLIREISTIQGIQQSIINAGLTDSSSDIKNNSSVQSAQLALDNATRDVQTAESNYEQAVSGNERTIRNAEQDVVGKQLALQNAQASYALKIAPPRAVDVANSKLQVIQAEESLKTAQQNMKDATVTAPIDGIIAKSNVHIGDIVTNGTATNGTAMITMITQQKYAQIALNEVDAAKVAVGQKANISFDALDSLNITGNVIAVDMLGTVSQGVVTYNVKVGFDTQDERIKPGMSANVSIITVTKVDALLVPSAAVKTQGTQSYVQVVENLSPAQLEQATTSGIALPQGPQNVMVETGSSNDTMTEILTGLTGGEQVVIRTIAPTTNRTPTTSGTNIRIPGIGGGVGGTGGSGNFRPGG